MKTARETIHPVLYRDGNCASQAEVSALKADVERLTVERDGLAATERVNAFTVRNVSTQRDTAAASLERARGLLRAWEVIARHHAMFPQQQLETRAFLAQPTPIATPGTEPAPCYCASPNGILHDVACPSATPGTPTEEET